MNKKRHRGSPRSRSSSFHCLRPAAIALLSALVVPSAAWGGAGGSTTTELASDTLGPGDPQLSPYPHFEYVRTFHPGLLINLAIDPKRFPSVRGKTCAIYVVDAKSESGWVADPILSDVRGASQLVFVPQAGNATYLTSP